MWQFLDQFTQWHWFILGLLLLIGEALGAAGFLLGTAVASLIMGIVVWIADASGILIPWYVQVFMGSVLAVVCSLLYWKKFRAEKTPDERPELNNRTMQLIGRRLVLAEDIEFEGRVQIGDTFWKVRSSESLKAGDNVEVIGADASTLEIEKR